MKQMVNQKNASLSQKKKSLEKAIYGTGDYGTDDKSLAEECGNIGTLDIQVSGKNGSCVEFFEHNDLKSMKKEEYPIFNT